VVEGMGVRDLRPDPLDTLGESESLEERRRKGRGVNGRADVVEEPRQRGLGGAHAATYDIGGFDHSYFIPRAGEGDGCGEPVRSAADYRRSGHAASLARLRSPDDLGRHRAEREILEQMNEIQGPTPAGTSRPYPTLREALRAHRIPEENHEFITAIVETVGTTALIDRGRYIEAIRVNEGPSLHIGKTYT